jgi:hypothetical protein
VNADAELIGDLLVNLARRNGFHHLALAIG